MTTCRTLVALLVMAVLVSGCKKPAEPDRPSLPAVTQAVEMPGCPNLYKINDVLYRGAQPTAEGFANLESLGIKTVLNLRDAHSDHDLLKGRNLKYVEIDMEAWDPEYDLVKQALQVIQNPDNHPVFVHCHHGADRTGTVIAAWRVAVDGWTKEQAIEEMVRGPYGFHDIWVMLPRFIRQLDVEKLRKDLNAASVSDEAANK
ncbi:MAG TPA: dual specificity protein phosphatase family protein [Anaerohalosphaeraceae bacterium]|jgi:protein tyrosine/serine phosphatase|nr:dual specificity protein phosphatase family protein [Anaerohalosphaeraceae bacterium]HRT50902.1 dual specificity protein phosphatase family protein [Anaerohalosphaeraceae bacterium]HRT86884.1 dual specificity protein phosphatase family protein [Anaerohalosphaeraceae bacterium]